MAPAFVSFIRLTFVKNQKVIYIEKSLVGGCSMLVVGFLNLVHRPDRTGPLVQVQQKLMHGRRPVAPAFLESIEFTQQMRTTQHMAGLGEFEIG